MHINTEPFSFRVLKEYSSSSRHSEHLQQCSWKLLG